MLRNKTFHILSDLETDRNGQTLLSSTMKEINDSNVGHWCHYSIVYIERTKIIEEESKENVQFLKKRVTKICIKMQGFNAYTVCDVFSNSRSKRNQESKT